MPPDMTNIPAIDGTRAGDTVAENGCTEGRSRQAGVEAGGGGAFAVDTVVAVVVVVVVVVAVVVVLVVVVVVVVVRLLLLPYTIHTDLPSISKRALSTIPTATLPVPWPLLLQASETWRW